MYVSYKICHDFSWSCQSPDKQLFQHLGIFPLSRIVGSSLRNPPTQCGYCQLDLFSRCQVSIVLVRCTFDLKMEQVLDFRSNWCHYVDVNNYLYKKKRENWGNMFARVSCVVMVCEWYQWNRDFDHEPQELELQKFRLVEASRKGGSREGTPASSIRGGTGRVSRSGHSFAWIWSTSINATCTGFA